MTGGRVVGEQVVHDGLWDPYNNQHMGMCAEKCAADHNISRKEQDDYAILTYQRAQEAAKLGSFATEIVPVTIKGRKVRWTQRGTWYDGGRRRVV